MGTVYRKTFTKPLPADAEIFTRRGERQAKWTDAKGRKRTAAVTTAKDGTPRVVIAARTFTAKYRDGSGVVREVATGCRDELAARSVLGDLQRRAELVKAEVLTAAENAVADHQSAPLPDHFNAHRDHLTAKNLNATRIRNTFARLNRLATDCGFRRLADLNANALERWLVLRSAEGMSAGNRNEYRQELVGFGNWCVRTGRLVANPFADVPKADARADRRRHRRSLTEDELGLLLYVARFRPLAEYGRETVRRDRKDVAGRKSWNREPLNLETLDGAVARSRDRLKDNPEFVERLEMLGRERAIVYKTLVLTGLRKGELASLTVGQAHLDGSTPFLELAAADEKNRQGSQIPLRADLAAELGEWLKERSERLRGGATIAMPCKSAVGLPSEAPLLTVPAGLVRILDRDLRAAGIPKRDERGRTVDVHALRHSFGTLLSKGGVAPRTAQAAMRHSTIDLTMNVYTDPKLLDVQGALDVLPTLSLDAERGKQSLSAKATGTDHFNAFPLAPVLAPTSGKSGQIRSIGVQTERQPVERTNPQRVAATPFAVKEKNPLTTRVSGLREVERKGVEPSTSALRTQRSPN
jgi:integrase